MRFATVRGVAMAPGGSAAVPEGDVMVRLYDGAIGPTQLAQAQASAALNAGMFNIMQSASLLSGMTWLPLK